MLIKLFASLIFVQFLASLSDADQLIDGHDISDYASIFKNAKHDPDYGLKTPEIIKSRGFNCETHQILTADGYILTTHRIINPTINANASKRVVIINHGLGSASQDFLINSPGGHVNEDIKIVGNNLGFELSKRGFDVWLTNNRGNGYSNDHINYSVHEDAFWNFSYQDMITYDLPASIDYVKHVTNSVSMAYIGHSQGTLIMFGLLSERPEYANIIKPFITMAPVASVGHIKTPIKYLLISDALRRALELKGGPFLPRKLLRKVAPKLCNLIPQSCKSLIFLIAGGADRRQINASRLPIYLSEESYGTSAKNMVHWGQNVKFKRFAKYDYGWDVNKNKYGARVPPEYAIENISSNHIILMNGVSDWLSDKKDVDILRSRIKVPLLEDYVIPDHRWGHVEFIWGKEAGKYVNEPILKYLHKNM